VKRLIHSIVLSWGWQRRLIAFALGAVSVLAMAPFDAWPVLFLTFPALVWLVDGAGVGRFGGITTAAVTGWWFGFGYFLAGLYWIGYAFLVDAPTFGWLLPIAVIGLPAVAAIYMALGLALARMLWMRGTMRIFSLAIALTVSEWLRGHLFTGFPWNALGYALTAPLPLAQAVSIFGIWGYTFVAVAVFASPATLTDDPAETRRPWLPLALSAAVLIALGGFGAWRLERTPTRLVDGVHLRIMQPNLQQDIRFNYNARHEVMSRYLALSTRAAAQPSTPPSPDSQAPALGDTTLLIWPESPFPFFLMREADALAQIASLLTPKAVLITGAMRLADPDNPAQSGVYNSIYVIDHSGSVAAVYDKVHLVPFGEYLPFEQILERIGLEELTEQRGGFLAGDRHRLVAVPNAPDALPLICYEVVFAGEVRPEGKRPGWIVNVTNDGWFGISTGPYQHFQQARVTAIELGLPLARAANTGISGVVDPVGRVINSLPLGEEGVVDSGLPRAIGATIYARFGDMPAGLLVGIVLIAVLRRRVRAGMLKV
jgi:apolipoprotein N-acyltransferase